MKYSITSENFKLSIEELGSEHLYTVPNPTSSNPLYTEDTYFIRLKIELNCLAASFPFNEAPEYDLRYLISFSKLLDIKEISEGIFEAKAVSPTAHLTTSSKFLVSIIENIEKCFQEIKEVFTC